MLFVFVQSADAGHTPSPSQCASTDWASFSMLDLLTLSSAICFCFAGLIKLIVAPVIIPIIDTTNNNSIRVKASDLFFTNKAIDKN